MSAELRLIGRDLRSSKGLTLCALVRDELFLISDFLNHYRTLGVERFIILDDRSEDGTREFLLTEPDVMVVESPFRFNDPVPVPKEVAPYRQTWMAYYLWRNQLMDMAGYDKVHLMVDADEFHVLPEGVSLHDVAEICKYESGGGRTIMGVVQDVYPRHPNDLKGMASITAGRWYFDAVPHIRLRPDNRPKIVYGGMRIRLYSKAGILPNQSLRERFKTLFRKRFISTRFINLYKPIMAYWWQGNKFVNTHNTIETVKGKYNQGILIPVVHHKLIPPLYNKIHRAIEEKHHFNESEDYFRMAQLMKYLEGDPKGFMGRDSQPVTGWSGFEQSGNAFGF